MLKNEMRSSYVTVLRKKRDDIQGLTGKLVLQMSEPHLVGQVKEFGPSLRSEAQRRIFEQRVPKYLWCRLPGTRIYMHLVGTYHRVIDDETERQYAPRYTIIVRDMLREAQASGLIAPANIDYFRDRPREELLYTEEQVHEMMEQIASETIYK